MPRSLIVSSVGGAFSGGSVVEVAVGAGSAPGASGGGPAGLGIGAGVIVGTVESVTVSTSSTTPAAGLLTVKAMTARAAARPPTTSEKTVNARRQAVCGDSRGNGGD
jgi:hypothetical protein